MRLVWITWEKQRRNRELSSAFSAKLFELAELDYFKSRVKKYFLGIFKTLLIIVRESPQVIFCQNPSLVLSLFLVFLRPFLKIPVCVDAHNGGLFPKEGRSSVLGAVSKFVQQRADLTIVSNEALKEHVDGNGGRAFVLPDKIPDFVVAGSSGLKGRINILFISSFGEDEPFMEVITAGRWVDPDIFIYVTGNSSKSGIDPLSLPKNIIMTGYLPEKEYLSMLCSVDATIDLTTREDCLVCGAYESLAVGKPMILSDTKALRKYFSKGTVYTENAAAGISRAISEVVVKRDKLVEEIRELKAQRETEWELQKKQLEVLVGKLARG